MQDKRMEQGDRRRGERKRDETGEERNEKRGEVTVREEEEKGKTWEQEEDGGGESYNGTMTEGTNRTGGRLINNVEAGPAH